MQELSKKKPYKMIWLEAERELALRGFLIQSINPKSSRIETDKLPVRSPHLPQQSA